MTHAIARSLQGIDAPDPLREHVVERVNAGIAVAREAGTQFGRPKSDPAVVGEKLAIVAQARSAGKTAAEAAGLVGWSRAILYRHQSALSRLETSLSGGYAPSSEPRNVVRDEAQQASAGRRFITVSEPRIERLHAS